MASKREGKGKLILWALRPSATTHSSHSHSLTSPAFNPSAGCVLSKGTAGEQSAGGEVEKEEVRWFWWAEKLTP